MRDSDDLNELTVASGLPSQSRPPRETRQASEFIEFPEKQDSRELILATARPVTALSVGEIEQYREDIATDLTQRELEVERRERSIVEQLAALDRDQRNFRLAEQAFEERCHLNQVAATAKEAELSQRLARCEELIAELEDEQAALDSDRAALQSQKQVIRDAALSELAAEQQAIDAERETLFAEKKEFRRRIEQHEKEIATARDELRESWETERDALRKQLTAKLAVELSADRREFEQEQLRWEDRRRDEQAALDEDRSAHENAVAKAKDELERLRRDQEIEFAKRRRELESEIDAKVRAAESALQKQRADWESERTAAETELRELRQELIEREAAQQEFLERTRTEFEIYREEQLKQIEAETLAQRRELKAEKDRLLELRAVELQRLQEESAALESARQNFEQESQQRRERITAELAQLRQQYERELESRQREFDQSCEASRIAIENERAAMENRLCFQKEHLERTRDELEEARRELDRQLQESQARAVELAESFRLRQLQLSRFRSLLDEREKSIERERALFREATQQVQEDRRREAERRNNDEEVWSRERETEQLAIKQLREDLGGRVEQLAARQARLDTLRLELETTHRENLELRVALDETWVKLMQTGAPEKAKQELQTTRTIVAEYFRKKESEIDRRRALLTDEVAVARRQLEQTETRRKELNDWLSTSLATLHRREDELKRWAVTLDARDARSQAVISRWRSEKSEVEGVIRGLLDQLANTVQLDSSKDVRTAKPSPMMEKRGVSGVSGQAIESKATPQVNRQTPAPHFRTVHKPESLSTQAAD